MSTKLLLSVVGLMGTVAAADTGIAEKTLKMLKDATVFIQAGTGYDQTSGSGFLYASTSGAGYIVTNAHVLEGRKHFDGRIIRVSFNSGSKEEKTFDAKFVGEASHCDLAFLKVEGKGFPPPINTSSKETLRETMPVLMVGFPFGKGLSVTQGNPAVTIGKGSVSSLRKNEDGELTYIQIDGNLNPGNSGGPIVDIKGGLVGIAVAKVASSNIGLVIPVSQLESFCQGRVDAASLSVSENQGGGIVKLRGEATITDPFEKIKSISFIALPKSKLNGEPMPERDGRWGPLSEVNSDQHAMTNDGDRAFVEFEVAVEAVTDARYYYQTKILMTDGKIVFNAPIERRVTSQEIQFAALSSPRPKANPSGGHSANPPLGVAIEGTKSLLDEPKQVLGLTVSNIKLPNLPFQRQMIWSADGKAIYVPCGDFFLRKLSVPDFKELRRVKDSGSWFALSKAGLLFCHPNSKEIAVVDPETLNVLGTIATPPLFYITAVPALNIAIGVTEDERELSIIDVPARRVLKTLRAHEIWQKSKDKVKKHPDSTFLAEFRHPTLSPDGRWFFCGGPDCLNRFRLDRNELVLEEVGAQIGVNPQRIEFSLDSLYVALPSGGGNNNATGHPKVKPYTTFVYKVADLQQPILSIHSGAYPKSLCMHKAEGVIYAQNDDNHLMKFDWAGVKQKEYVLTRQGDSTERLILHPGGKALLVLTREKLLWVAFPK